MKIGLDYDECFTEDPQGWKFFVELMKSRGHEVKFVTYRPDVKGTYNEDIHLDASWVGISIVFTGGKQKANFYDADVWIDDRPETIPVARMLGGMYEGCLANNDMED